MDFEVVGAISNRETFATGRSIRELPRLIRLYGRGRWRKREGIATVRLEGGTTRRLKRTGTKLPVWYQGIEDQALFGFMSMATDPQKSIELAICIRNEDYAASLELRKLQQRVPDTEAAELGQLRMVDESGEDYLYPESYFVRVQQPEPVEQAVIDAAQLRADRGRLPERPSMTWPTWYPYHRDASPQVRLGLPNRYNVPERSQGLP